MKPLHLYEYLHEQDARIYALAILRSDDAEGLEVRYVLNHGEGKPKEEFHDIIVRVLRARRFAATSEFNCRLSAKWSAWKSDILGCNSGMSTKVLRGDHTSALEHRRASRYDAVVATASGIFRSLREERFSA